MLDHWLISIRSFPQGAQGLSGQRGAAEVSRLEVLCNLLDLDVTLLGKQQFFADQNEAIVGWVGAGVSHRSGEEGRHHASFFFLSGMDEHVKHV